MRTAAVLLAILSGGPAFASCSIDCLSPDGDASVSLTIGSVPVLAIVGAFVEADGKSLEFNRGGENTIVLGQAFREDGVLKADFTDPNVERVMAEIRLFTASEGEENVTAGTLRVDGAGVWALQCTGP